MLGRLGHQPVRVDDEFVRDAGIEIPVALGGLVEGDDLDVDDLADLEPAHRIACISCRLYFSTGVCPLCRLCDFAQPRPKRRLSIPRRAAFSFAPGSSVT